MTRTAHAAPTGPNPRVSVLLAAYNAAPYITEAVEGIQRQTMTDWELVAINDGSTDGTGECLDALARNEPRIRVLHQENQGIAKTTNRLVSLARAPWVAIQDADDVSDPDRLATQLAAVARDEAIQWCGSWMLAFGAGLDAALIKYHELDSTIRAEMPFQFPFGHPTILARRTLLQDLQYDASFPSAMDYHLAARVPRHAKFHNIQRALVRYRRHTSQITKRLPEDVLLSQNRNIWKLLFEPLGLRPTDDDMALHRDITMWKAPTNLDTLRQIGNWLECLRWTNRTHPAFPAVAFERELAVRWYGMCARAAGLGLPVLAEWASGPFGLNDLTPTWPLKLGLKCMLSEFRKFAAQGSRNS